MWSLHWSVSPRAEDKEQRSCEARPLARSGDPANSQATELLRPCCSPVGASAASAERQLLTP